jgi:hypothetical protein
MSELVSEAKFPQQFLQWLRRNSLHLGTGNLFAPNRELEGDIRELDSLIREPGLWLLSPT